MSLTVKALNGDTSFLLTFAPPIASDDLSDPGQFPGSYTILIDPWLTGSADIISSRFSSCNHVPPFPTASLAELPEPDMIIISQDKPDHCHEETLCQLSPHITSAILAAPAAARKIRSWQHFDSGRIESLQKYNPARPATLYRLEIPSFSPSGESGEVTVAFMPSKRDMTGVHNTVGITYRPPSSVLSTTQKATYHSILPTPPHSPSMTTLSASVGATPVPFSPSSVSFPPSPGVYHRPSTAHSLNAPLSPLTSLPMSPSRPTTSQSQRSVPISFSQLSDVPPVPPLPPAYASSAHQVSSLQLHSSTIATERVLSVLYSPHGFLPTASSNHLSSYLTPLLRAYATSHLMPLAALPLTCLIHPFNDVKVPWYKGGIVSAGAPSGWEVIRGVGARSWISAHDGDKDVRGWGVRGMKTKVYAVDEVVRGLGGAGVLGCEYSKEKRDSGTASATADSPTAGAQDERPPRVSASDTGASTSTPGSGISEAGRSTSERSEGSSMKMPLPRTVLARRPSLELGALGKTKRSVTEVLKLGAGKVYRTHVD
ncbi:hypothetical protein P152DRAFT_462504 [Eremomyces bilateralis CBS 781.70]|uniref:Metallo-hydrolase/oxidoreductase n=1 Tax=Eremomyces bilateralis CBS 781.70 TaxID=1392243 RepID=A0A6G1FRT8_9PEZI|nr:uncharacterized protein P152DRAFT_462504 [Eremomyces bilateralis CBS 781.70]KAF1808504.1 hypothetical protein P152DRAFT_462504 [Eremomyces bilateralis CBS 781.70]